MKNQVLYILFCLCLQACAGYNYVQPPNKIYLLPQEIACLPEDTITAVAEPQTRYLRGSRAETGDYEEPDPLLGKIVFTGPNNPFEYEAVVRVDGRCIGVIPAGGYTPVRLPNFGRHIITAKFYWVRHNSERNRRVLVDTYQDDFYVSPVYPIHHDGQYWWSREVRLSVFHFFSY